MESRTENVSDGYACMLIRTYRRTGQKHNAAATAHPNGARRHENVNKLDSCNVIYVKLRL